MEKTLLMIENWDVLELKQATKPGNSKNNRIAQLKRAGTTVRECGFIGKGLRFSDEGIAMPSSLMRIKNCFMSGCSCNPSPVGYPPSLDAVDSQPNATRTLLDTHSCTQLLVD
ncbi:11984_t:CDS:2 [Funneliformis caledonium]|uniref:11984_t:CDS:1 n=1 Tax=Funneliformis caledonium TaxID=1117310 RepID=A0A9N8W7E9_9GLOM|nr:11984_t:CDS:2 [Funneliformis caledonium]